MSFQSIKFFLLCLFQLQIFAGEHGLINDQTEFSQRPFPRPAPIPFPGRSVPLFSKIPLNLKSYSSGFTLRSGPTIASAVGVTPLVSEEASGSYANPLLAQVGVSADLLARSGDEPPFSDLQLRLSVNSGFSNSPLKGGRIVFWQWAPASTAPTGNWARYFVPGTQGPVEGRAYSATEKLDILSDDSFALNPIINLRAAILASGIDSKIPTWVAFEDPRIPSGQSGAVKLLLLSKGVGEDFLAAPDFSILERESASRANLFGESFSAVFLNGIFERRGLRGEFEREIGFQIPKLGAIRIQSLFTGVDGLEYLFPADQTGHYVPLAATLSAQLTKESEYEIFAWKIPRGQVQKQPIKMQVKSGVLKSGEPVRVNLESLELPEPRLWSDEPIDSYQLVLFCRIGETVVAFANLSQGLLPAMQPRLLVFPY